MKKLLCKVRGCKKPARSIVYEQIILRKKEKEPVHCDPLLCAEPHAIVALGALCDKHTREFEEYFWVTLTKCRK